MKYFAYNRKSTDEAGNQVLSLETQKRITDDIALRSSLEVIETFQEARSAKKPDNRPLFSRMLKEIRAGKAQGLIVAHIDRLSRNGTESAQVIQLFELGFLKEIRTGSKTYNSVEDILYMDFDFVFASHFSRNLSKRVKEGMETKRQRGEYPTRAPIGYVNRDAKIYPDPKYAGYVKLAFSLYGEGTHPLIEIRDMLHNKGMRTRDTGNKVQKSTVHDILTNPVYYGAIRSFDKLYKGVHEPLISKALFDRVQDILHGKCNTKKQKHEYLYRGYLICGICGCRYTASTKKEKHTYYYCTNAKGICDQRSDYLVPDDVTDALQEVFNPFSLVEADFAKLAYDTYINDLKSSKDSDEMCGTTMKVQIAEIDEKLKRLLDLLLDKRIDEKEYDRKRKDLANDRVQMELQLRNLKPMNPEATLERLEQFKERAMSVYSMFKEGDDPIRSDLLKSVLWNASVINGNVTSQQYKQPWDTLEKGLKSGNFKTMYPQPDSNRRFTG